MNDMQSWFLEFQQQMLERVGEPVMLTVRMAFDEWFEVEVCTFTDRRGVSVGSKVEQAIEEAVQMLLEMDEVIAEIGSRSA